MDDERLIRATKNIDEKDRLPEILAYDESHDIHDAVNILQISKPATIINL